MKKLINILLFLLPLSIFAQTDPVEFTGIVTGKCNIAQTGSGSGYWQVSVTNYSSPRGTDCTELQVDDIVYFNDGGTSIALPIILISSAVGNTATLRLNNTGITSIGSVPTTPAIISRGSTNFKLPPWAANTSGNDNQMVNEYMCYLIDSLIANSGASEGSGVTLIGDSLNWNGEIYDAVELDFPTTASIDWYNPDYFSIYFNDFNSVFDMGYTPDSRAIIKFQDANDINSGFGSIRIDSGTENGVKISGQNDSTDVTSSLLVRGDKIEILNGATEGTQTVKYYFDPAISPSNTNLAKSIMTWTGNGSTTTPAFEDISSAVPTIYTASDSITGGDRYIAMDSAGSQNLGIGYFENFPDYGYDIPEYGLYISPQYYGTVALVNGADQIEAYNGAINLTSNAGNGASIRVDGANSILRLSADSMNFFSKYAIPNATPSITSSAKSDFLYTGTGSATTPSFVRKDYGNASGSTDGSGDLVVSCVMPDAGYVVNIIPTGSTLGVGYTVTTKGSSSFTVRAFDTSTKAAITGTAVTFDWTLVDN